MYARVRENSIGECIGVALLTKAAEGFAQKGADISHGLVRVLHEARLAQLRGVRGRRRKHVGTRLNAK